MKRNHLHLTVYNGLREYGSLSRRGLRIFRYCLSLLLVQLCCLVSYAQVSVTATAGTSGPTAYTTLKAAFDAVNAGTHQGDVTINIDANTSETAPCVLNSSGAGSASYTSVLVQPGNDGVSVSGATVSGRGLIELNGADNVTINGDNPNTPGNNRNLTIQNTAAVTVGFTSCIRIATSSLISTADNNSIKNCVLIGAGVGRNISTATSEVTSWGIIASGGASTAAATTAPSALTSATSTSASGQTYANLQIFNNQITMVTRGISINGGATSVAMGLVVSNNIIGNPVEGSPDQVTSAGIYVTGSGNGIISGNTIMVEGFIQSSGTTIGSRGMEIGTNTTLTIERNTIARAINNVTNTYAAYGININGGTGNVIRNNFIYGVRNDQTTGTGGFSNSFGAFGIRLAAGTGHIVQHNTVHLTGVLPGSTNADIVACLTITTTSVTGCDIRNNIFSNQMTGGNPVGTNTRFTCIVMAGGTSTLNLNLNNNAYFQGPTPLSTIAQNGFTNTSSVAFLATDFDPSTAVGSTNLRSYTSGLNSSGTNDGLSYAAVGAPPVVSNTDLHIVSTGISPLESTGAPVGVSVDIDGDVRPGPAGSINGGAVAPDMGADEFDGEPQTLNDFGVWSFVSPVDNEVISIATTVNPTVIFKNFGLAPQTNVTVRFRILDATNSVVYNETSTVPSLVYGATTDVVFPGAVLPAAGSYTFEAKTELVGDMVPANDLMTGTFEVIAPLCGTIHVGAAQPAPFQTITSAIATLNAAGVSCPVTFLLDDAAYDVNETYPIILNASIPGVGAGNTITIKPNTGVTTTISGAINNNMLFRILSSHVTIDGSNAVGGTTRDLTITNTATTSPQAILIASVNPNPVTDVTVKNVVLVNGSNTTSTITLGASGSTPSTASAGYFNDITIQNIHSHQTNHGIYVTAVSATGNGSGLLIADNTFDNIRTNGVSVLGVTGATITGNNISIVDGAAVAHYGVLISTNTINSSVTNNVITANYNGTSTGSAVGIGVGTGVAASGITVSNNLINGITSTGTTTTATSITSGIKVAGATGGVSILANQIKNVHNGHATGYAAYGIHLNSSVAASGVNVFNNMIAGVSSMGSGTLANNANGIYIASGGGYKLMNNTVHMFTNPGAGTQAALHVASGVSSSAAMDIRNNIFSNAQTTATSYAIYSAVTTGNNTGVYANLDYNDYWSGGTNLGYFSASTQANLAALQAFQNANSKQIMPVFTTNYDLHMQNVTGNLLLDNMGVSVADVTVDIDGQPRDATNPDMGAHEFTVVNCTGSVGGIAVADVSSFCVSGSATLTASGYSDGAGTDYQWEWSNDNFVADINDLTGETNAIEAATGTITATTYYRLRVSCSNSVSTSYSNIVTVTINPSPTASVTPDPIAPICAPNTELLTAVTNATNPQFEWYHNGSPVGTSSTYAAGLSGNYSVKVTEASTGCSTTSAAAALTVMAQPGAVTVTPSTASYCAPGAPVMLTASGGSVSNLVIFSEDFNGATHSFTDENFTAGPNPPLSAWILRPDGYVYNASYPDAYHSNDNSQFIHSNSDPTGSSSFTTKTRLISPPINTIGYTSLSLSYYQYYKDYNAADSANVDVSTDNVNWTTLLTTKAAGDYGAYNSFQQITIPLDDYVGEPTLYIRFRYDAAWGYWWALDNVAVTASGNTDLTWSPLAGLYTDVSGTVPYTGDPETTVYAHPTTTTTYSAIATGVNGCANEGTAEITVNMPPVGLTTADPEVICGGSSTLLTAGVCTPLAGFQDAYAPANWIVNMNNSDGTVNTSGAPASIVITSGDNGSDDPGTTSFSVTAVCSGSISFNWAYTTLDGSEYDYPRYILNGGAPVIFSGYSITPNSGVPQSGTQTVSVNAGDVLTIQMYTVDNTFGRASVTISDLSAPGVGVNPDITVEWYDQPSGGTLLASGATYSASPAASGTSTYYAELANSVTGCDNPTRVPVMVSVNPVIAGNTISADQTICGGTTPAALTGGVPTGGDGTYTYLWESSTTDATTGFAPAAGTNSGADYSPGALTQTTWYRRTVTSGGCTDVSATVEISIQTIDNNTVSGTQTICEGATPTMLAGSTPTGGVGGYTYLWESSTTNAAAGFAPASGTNTDIDYTAGALTATTWYRRTVYSGGCENTSSAVAVMVNPLPSGVTADASLTTICEGAVVDLMAGPATATFTLLSEDFNGATTSFTAVNNTTGSDPAMIAAAAWTLRPDGYVYNTTYPTAYHSNDNSQFYHTNSDPTNSSHTTKTHLISPAFSTMNVTTATLTYYQFYKDYNSNDSASVDVSTDGVNWTNVKSTKAPGDYGLYAAFQQVTVPLDDYVGEPTVYIRFRYDAVWGYWWALDNVTVTGTADNSFAWTSSPAGFSSAVQNPTGLTPATTTTYSVTVTDANGCEATDDVTVTVNALPIGLASADPAEFCLGESTTLSACGSNSGFAGPYDPMNWTATNNNSDGTVTTTGAPGSITMTSGDNNSEDPGVTGYSITIPCNGVVSFNWAYTTSDGSAYDYPRYVINGGTPVIFAGFTTTPATTNPQNGTANIPVNAGDVLTLQMYTADNLWGAGTLVISNLTAPSGGADLTINWYDQASGGTLLGTGGTYVATPAASGSVTYYVDLTTTASGCNNPTRIPVSVTANPVIANNTMPAGQVLCSGGVPTALVGGVPTGGNGTYTYLWESSTTSATTGFAAAAGTNNGADYTPGILAQTTWYRRTVTSGGCTDVSAAVEISVQVIDNNTISGTQAICEGATPTMLSGATPTGGVGGFTYVWESSTTSASTGFAPAAGINNGVDYTPGALTQTTWYRRVVHSGSCDNTSAAVKVTVNPLPTGVTADASLTTICAGGTVDLMASAAPGSVTLFSEDFNSATVAGFTAVNNTSGSNPTMIAAAAWTLRPDGYVYNTTYPTAYHSNDNSQFMHTNSDPTNNTHTTRTHLVSNAFSTMDVNSATLTYYQFYKDYNANDSASVDVSTDGVNWTTVKSTKAPGDYGLYAAFEQVTVSLDDYVGEPTVYIRFRYDAVWGFWWALDNVTVTGSADNSYAWTSSPAGFTSADQNPMGVAPSGTTTYTVTVSTPNGCEATDDVTVTVNPAIDITSQPQALVSVCEGNDLTLTVAATGATAYQWRVGGNPVTGPNVSGANSSMLTISDATPPDAGSYDVVITGNATCPDETSTASAVTVNPMGTSLPAANASSTSTQTDGTDHIYTDASCQPIAMIEDGAGGNVLGVVTVTVTVESGVQYAPADNAPYVQRHYVITPANNGPATLTIYATQAEFDAYNAAVPWYPQLPTGGVDNGNVRITKYSGNTIGSGTRTFITPSSVVWNAANSYWEITFPVTDFSSFFIHTGDDPLVIEIRNIAAENDGDKNRVDWVTENEDRADRFELERSADGAHFSFLATVAAKGVSSTYRYWDLKPVDGWNYYRLKMYDKAGNFSYSNVAKAYMKGGSFSVDAFPNPVSANEVTVRVSGSIGDHAAIHLTDVMGKLIRSYDVKGADTKIDVTNLASGVYFIKYVDGVYSQTIKLNRQ